MLSVFSPSPQVTQLVLDPTRCDAPATGSFPLETQQKRELLKL